MPSCDHCGLPAGEGVSNEGGVFCCYGCRMMAETVGGDEAADTGDSNAHDALLIRVFAGFLMAGFVMAFSLAISSGYGFGALQRLEHDVGTAHYVLLAAALPALAVLGLPVLRAALRDLRRGRPTLNVLFTLGTAAAVAVSAVSYIRGTGPIYLETAVMLLALYTLGRYLTARAKGTATQVMRRLLTVPETPVARLTPNPGDVPPDALRPGDVIRVPAGGVMPVDGQVQEGRSYVDESTLSGESRPVLREPGDPVYAGTALLDGALVVETTAVDDDRRLARIEAMMHAALREPPRLASLLDRILRWLLPGVVVLAVVTFGAWWHLAGVEKALYTALSVVLITCPCALGIAIPLSLVNSLGTAARRGIVVRNGRTLLDLAAVDRIVLDKTGTLSTVAAPSVRVVVPDGVPAGGAAAPAPTTLLARAAAVEQGTEHVLAEAVREAARDLPKPPARDLRTEPGAGAVGTVVPEDGAPVRVGVGNEALVRRLGASCPPDLARRRRAAVHAGHTVLHVMEDDRVAGLLVLEETPRPDAADAVAAMQAAGLSPRILTGDRPATAERLAKALGLPAEAGLTPDAKLNRLRALQARHGAVAMVGDGINDAAALAAADVGIALRSGAPTALEAADVTLYNPDLRGVTWLHAQARRTRRVIHQNLAWTFAYNGVGLTLAVGGLLHPIAAVIIMTASSLLVTANAFRLKRSDEALNAPERPTAADPAAQKGKT